MTPIDADEIERICERLAAMSERHAMRDSSRDLTFRFPLLRDVLPVLVHLEGRWRRLPDESTSTQAAFDVAGTTVTLFCPEMMMCRDHIGRGVGTLREGKDFAAMQV